MTSRIWRIMGPPGPYHFFNEDIFPSMSAAKDALVPLREEFPSLDLHIDPLYPYDWDGKADAEHLEWERGERIRLGIPEPVDIRTQTARRCAEIAENEYGVGGEIAAQIRKEFGL